MRPRATRFLQAVIVLIGTGALALLLWEPHLEGRNAHATLFEIYFKDPFLAYVYTASILFFVALYQAVHILGLIRENQVFSQATVRALRIIRHCAVAIVGFVLGAVLFIFLFGEQDGRPPAVFMGTMFILGSITAATAAAVLESIFQKAIGKKAEIESGT
ncbi:MAG: DUF2975 domain-containing protein [Bryobacterales bacterium]|nr:DUF2975 domain-containing protein [Bryobacterales bacterium]